MRRTTQLGTLSMLGSALALVATATGCVLSPQPLPPSIDGERLTIELISTDPDRGEIDTARIIGAPGAVSPGGAVLHTVNLELANEATELTVAEDGSFEVYLTGQPGQEFRLRAFSEGLWSRPEDIVAPAEDGPPDSPVRPLGDCLSLSAPLELGFGPIAQGDITVDTIELTNHCGETLRLDDVRLRIGDAPPPNCEDQYLECSLEPDVHPREESPCFETCGGECSLMCDEEYQRCRDEGLPEEDCLQQRDDCTRGCFPEGEPYENVEQCYMECCDAVLMACQESDEPRPQGFAVHHAPLPMIIPAGAVRSLVVTFAPLWPGPAEDELLITVGAPESERRPITLTGEGVDE